MECGVAPWREQAQPQRPDVRRWRGQHLVHAPYMVPICIHTAIGRRVDIHGNNNLAAGNNVINGLCYTKSKRRDKRHTTQYQHHHGLLQNFS